MLFSDKGVDPNLISWNRVVLLHGPPGTIIKYQLELGINSKMN